MHDEEYSALRSEILTHINVEHQIYVATVVGTGALLAFGIDSPSIDPLVFLTPLVVIIPFAFAYAARVDHIIRTGQYIRVFHEGSRAGASGWGSRIVAAHAKRRHEWLGTVEGRFVSTLLFVGLGIASLALYASKVDYFTRFDWVLFTVVAIFLLRIELMILSLPRRSQFWHETWNAVRREELEREQQLAS